MTNIIGIKIANGEFYPIMEENSSLKKRLILTTVRDYQTNVQIDLYRSPTKTMIGAQYIGSLVIDNINSKLKREPSIEMVISSTPDGNIVANAVDLDKSPNGEHEMLSVSLKSLDESNQDISKFDLPDFVIEENTEPPSGLYENTKETEEKKKKRSPLLIIIGLILLLLVLAALWFFFLGGRERFPEVESRVTELFLGRIVQRAQEPPSVPREATDPPPVFQPPVLPFIPPPVPTPIIPAPVSPPGVSAPPAGMIGPPATVASFTALTALPIAHFNNINDQNNITSGQIIRLPPRNEIF